MLPLAPPHTAQHHPKCSRPHILPTVHIAHIETHERDGNSIGMRHAHLPPACAVAAGCSTLRKPTPNPPSVHSAARQLSICICEAWADWRAVRACAEGVCNTPVVFDELASSPSTKPAQFGLGPLPAHYLHATSKHIEHVDDRRVAAQAAVLVSRDISRPNSIIPALQARS